MLQGLQSDGLVCEMGLKINLLIFVWILCSLKIEFVHEFENFIRQNKMNESFVHSISTWHIAIKVMWPSLNL